MKPYYEASGITIYHGDCEEVLPEVTADVVIADPPYGVGKAAWDTEFPTRWIPAALRCAPRVLCMPGNTALIRAGAAFGAFYRDCLVLHAINGMTRSAVAFGNWYPVLVIGEWNWQPRPNVLRFTVQTQEEIGHPSPKPLSGIQKLVATYTESEWVICDPFMGSGTTLVAAKNLGRTAIGIEIEERYCEVAAKRLSQEVLDLGGAA